MIRGHRRRHLRAFAVLAVVLPAILVVALAARRSAPVVAAAPAALTNPALDSWVPLDSADARILEVPIRVRLVAPPSSTPSIRIGIELEPARAITRPDVLVYWIGSSPEARNGLPPEALLLGSMGGARPLRFALPEAALQDRGRLILFSAAHDDLLGTLPVPQVRLGVTPSP